MVCCTAEQRDVDVEEFLKARDDELYWSKILRGSVIDDDEFRRRDFMRRPEDLEDTLRGFQGAVVHGHDERDLWLIVQRRWPLPSKGIETLAFRFHALWQRSKGIVMYVDQFFRGRRDQAL